MAPGSAAGQYAGMTEPPQQQKNIGESRGTITVLLVDDSVAFSNALALLIAGIPGAQFVGSVRSGEDAQASVAALRPRLVLVDLNLPGINGIEATRRIKAQHDAPRVVILTFHDTADYREGAMHTLADGYLLKSNVVAELPALIESLLREPHEGLGRA